MKVIFNTLELLTFSTINFTLTESSEELHPQGSEYEEEEEEEEAEVADLRQGLHHRVEKGTNSLGHFKELEDSGNSEDSHHPDDGGVDREDWALHLLQSYSRQ